MGGNPRVTLATGLALLALAAACVTTTRLPTPPSPASSGTTSFSSPVPARYEATVIVPDARWVEWIAAGDTQLFLALNELGARPGNTESRVAAVPLTGGDLVALPGTDALGIGIGGIAASGDVVYFSRVGGPNLRDSGVFRYSNGALVAVARDLRRPAGIVLDGAGDLFVADTDSGSVRRISGGAMTTYAGRGGCGDRNPPIAGPAIDAALCGVQLLAMNAGGDLYVAGIGPTWIAKVDRVGRLSVFAKDFGRGSLAIDISGALLAARGRELVRFNAAGSPTVIADDLGLISAISVDGDGSIYVLHSSASGATSRVTRLRAI